MMQMIGNAKNAATATTTRVIVTSNRYKLEREFEKLEQ